MEGFFVSLIEHAFPGATLGAGPAAAPSTTRAGGGAYRRGLKRVVDLAVVLMLALPVLAVVLILVALVMRDGHSPFFLQERLGKGGRVFRMVKLRTMVPNAERVLADTLAASPAARAEWEHHQKLRRDPRITPVGALLRRTSLDELPQLVNVALGHMSLVGPRPMMPCQRSLYPGHEYFEMRPGVTGFWQVADRHESSFAERAAFDRRYHEELSFGTDLRVMWQTVGVVASASGC